MQKLIRWLCGGQERSFFRDHQQHILSQNVKMMGLVITAMSVITGFYALFDLNSGGERKMRVSYLIFFGVFLALHLLHEYYFKKQMKDDGLYIFTVYQLVFIFLLLVGPIYDARNLACYIPCFFLCCFTLSICPIYFTGCYLLVDLCIFIFVDIIYKTPELARLDIADTVTCGFLGIVIGQNILRARLNEIAAYEELKRSSQTELAQALALANKDPLTGVRSRAAYESLEKELNLRIQTGNAKPFAIVVADVNGLKVTNDTLGHDAGDELLRDTSSSFCHVFAHSPVFRIGGDEFAAILRGTDYDNRDRLIDAVLQEREELGRAMYACGISDYQPGADATVTAVFVRADSAMYVDKKALHACRK